MVFPFRTGMLPTSVAIAGLLAAFAGGARGACDDARPAASGQQTAQVKQPKSEAPRAMDDPAVRSLDIIVAKHVILWDGRIRTWDEVVAELREIRAAQGKPIHPHFHFTTGAHAERLFDVYQAKAFELDRELFQPAGMSFGSIAPVFRSMKSNC